MKLTLKSKFIISITGIILFFGTLATVSVYFYSLDILVNNEKKNLEFTTKKISDEVGQVMIQGSLVVKSMGSDDEIIEYMDNPIIEYQDTAILHQLKDSNIGEAYSAIYLIKSDGVTVASTDPTFLGKNYGFRDYFENSLEGSEYVGISLGVTSGEFGYYFSHPVYNKNKEIVGVVVAKMKPEFIHDVVKEASLSEDFNLMLVDDFGIIIFSERRERELKSLGTLNKDETLKLNEYRRFEGIEITPIQYEQAQDVIRKIKNKVELIEFYDKLEEEEELIAISRIKDFNFFIVIEEEYKNIIDQARRIAQILGIFILFAALSATLIILYLVGLFLRPLAKFSKLSKEVSSGNLSVRVEPVKHSLEFNNLANIFNKMLDDIKESRTNIESQVKKQTKEIVLNNLEIKKQQKAVLNILEDVEEERDKSKLLAADLEKFKLAVDSGYNQIVITDPDGIVIYANKATERVTGYKIKEIIGKKAGGRNLWGGHMDLDFYKKMWKTLKVDKKVFSGEVLNKKKSGEMYTVMATISPVIDKDKNVIFFVAIERDITREKEIDKAKTEFVSLASHQLRTPLSAISWYTEMLMAGDAGKLNKEQMKYLGEIYNGNRNMVELVNSLLNVSRIELGSFNIEPKKSDLRDIMDSVIKIHKTAITNKKINIKTNYQKDLPEVNVDVKLMTMVFQNLVNNAIKYNSKNGKVDIDISVKNKNIITTITDNGLGIPKEQHSKIFTKLFRADNVRKTSTDGTGLGLYLVKSILDNSGGKVEFSSEADKGATFIVYLPLTGMKQREGTKKLT